MGEGRKRKGKGGRKRRKRVRDAGGVGVSYRGGRRASRETMVRGGASNYFNSLMYLPARPVGTGKASAR